MACLVGYGAYRTEVLDHAVPVRLIGPDGRQHRSLSRSLSRIFDKRRREEALRHISAFVWSLNVAHASIPDVADQYVRGVDGCRDAQDAFVTALNIKTDPAAERDGSMWLKPKREIYTKVSDALVAMGLVTAALINDEYEGQDPSKVDAALSRQGKRHEQRRQKKEFRSDVDRRLRLGANPNHAPRFDDPRFFDRWAAGLVETGAPEVFRRMLGLARHGGGRYCQIGTLTVHDLLVRPEKEGDIPCPNKGSDGERTMVMVPIRSEYDALLAWVAGTRAELTGMSLEALRLKAADPLQRDELIGMPLFTEDGVNPIKYPRLYRVLRRAAVAADLYIEDEEFRCTGRRRYVSFHYCRHEYVHARLDIIDGLPVAERPAARKALIAYMKWGRTVGERMLDWYSAHHTVKIARQSTEEVNKVTEERLAREAKTPMGLGEAVSIADRILEGLCD